MPSSVEGHRNLCDAAWPAEARRLRQRAQLILDLLAPNRRSRRELDRGCRLGSRGDCA